MAAAQSSPQEKSNSFELSGPHITAGTNLSGDFKNERLVQQSLGKLSADELSKLQAHLAELNPRQLPQQLQADNTCYAIRSYIFRREDLRAPVLVKTTTCTHVLTGFRRAVQPKVMRVPSSNQPVWATSYQPL
jgi:hypothetical protein